MASDVIAVMNELDLEAAAFVGWSDGACVALVLAHDIRRLAPAGCSTSAATRTRVAPGSSTGTIRPLVAVFAGTSRTTLSPTPDQFNRLLDDVRLMQRTRPNYSAADLAQISVPVAVAQSEHDEFIEREHAEYLATTIPDGRLMLLPGVSHFAPLQDPQLFTKRIVEFLSGLSTAGRPTQIVRGRRIRAARRSGQ